MRKIVSCLLVVVLLFSVALPTSLIAKEKENNGIEASMDGTGNNEVNLKESVAQTGALSDQAGMLQGEPPVIDVAGSREETSLVEPEMATEALSDGVNFPDANLFNALIARGVDQNGDGNITQSEMAAIDSLLLYYKNITDLTGMEYFVNLNTLSLWGNANLSDIEPLRNLKNLRSLSLPETNVSNIEPIRDLALTYLYLEDTPVSDADKVSLVRLTDQAGTVGGIIYQEIVPNGLCDAYTVSSSDESIAVAAIEKINEYSNPKIKITGKKSGTATISLMIGTAKKDFKVTVNATPADAITFNDSNLFNALIADGRIDQNKDGIITREELGKVTYLSLNNCNLKDITELGYATALQSLWLENNAELSNIDSLKSLSKLTQLALKGTAVSDGDKLSFVTFRDLSGIKGYGQTLTIIPRGLATNYAITSSDESIVETTITNADAAYQYTSITLLYKKEGAATVTVRIGSATKAFQVTVSPAPQGAINFEDYRLGKALIDGGVDRNGDGYISVDELSQVKKLELYNQGLKSLKGLESATALEYLYLSFNPDLTDLTPIRNIASNLKVLEVVDTGVSADEKLSFLVTDDQTINQGASYSFIRPEGLIQYKELPDTKLTFSNPEIAAIDLTRGLPYITGKNPGKTVVTVEYHGASTSFNLTVNTVDPNQPVGEKVTVLPVLYGKDQIDLDDKGNLFDLSSGEAKLVKTGVKTYENMGAAVPSQDNEPDNIRQWATILDNLNTLWLWDATARDKSPTEQVKNVKKTVSEYVYTTDSLYCYDNFGLALDNSNGLWMMKNDRNDTGYTKVMDNVADVSWTFALDTNHILWQFYEGKKELLTDVEDYDFVVPSRNTDAPVYALKTDHSLWYGKSVTGEFTKIAENVDHLVKGVGVRGFVKTDGTSWEYESAGSSSFKQVSESYRKKILSFIVKNDGSTWYTPYMGNPIKVLDTELKEWHQGYDAAGNYMQFLLDVNNILWNFDSKTYEAIQVGENIAELTGVLGTDNRVRSIYGYINDAGDWLDVYGKSQANENVVFAFSLFSLKGDKVLYHQNVPLLNQVVRMSVADNNAVYATRTDGTVWLVSPNAAPTKIKTASQPTDPTESGFVAFLGKDPSGNYYEYNAADLNNAYLAYQINPKLASAKMYQQFLSSQCKVVALKDGAKGYMDYNAAATASLMAQMKGEAFDVNAYLASADAKKLAETVGIVKTVDKDGNIL